MDRNETIKAIRKALKARTLKPFKWSVTGGRGTAWGWIHISIPPSRVNAETRNQEDWETLAKLLNIDAGRCWGGYSIPASSDYRQEAIDRANGREPSVTGSPYWD